MNRCTRLSLAAAAFLLLGCRGETVSPPLSGPMFAVSDGAHNGNPDFFFLPPMFRNPSNTATFEPAAFNPNLRPVIEICELAGTVLDAVRACAGPPIKRLSGSAISVVDEQYQANWNTAESNLLIGKDYRITVLVGTEPLGFADVDPVPTGAALKNVQTGEFIGLVDGRTLPIRFRIETGALCAQDDVPCASGTINVAQGGGVELNIPGLEHFKFDIPANTQATFGGQPVTDITFNLELCDGIDVDLRTFGACLRVTTFFDVAGGGVGTELLLTNPALISMCVLEPGIPHEQEELITLHQQDGALIRALPHARPNCEEISSRTEERPGFAMRGWRWFRDMATRMLTPKPLYARTRTALFNLGAGGNTDVLGAECNSGDASARQMALVECGGAVAPQRVAAQDATTIRTSSDFQFALPAMMDFLDPDDAARAGLPGAVLPTAVKLTDWAGAAVEGATVTFTEPAIEGPGVILGTAVSDAEGIASIDWTIEAGNNTVIASGRGIAARNNFPAGTPVRPFQPDISLEPEAQTPVVLRLGALTFTATGGQADLIIESLTQLPVEPSDAELIEYTAVVRNIGTAPAGRFSVLILLHEDDDGVPGRGLEATTLSSGPAGTFLNPGDAISLRRQRTLQLPVESYVLLGTADNQLEVAESNEGNNTAQHSFGVSRGVNDFETFFGGAPACASCELTNQFAVRGAVFSFVPASETCTGLTSALLFLSSGVYDPVGSPENHSVTASASPGGGFCGGTVNLALASLPTQVTFRLRGNSEVQLYPVSAFDASGGPIPAGQTIRTDISLYESANGVFVGRQETVTISNAAGIARVSFGMNGFIVLIDNLFISP